MLYIKVILLLVFLTLNSFAKALKIDNNTSSIDILSHSSIYIDNSKKLSLKDIKNKPFKNNQKNQIGYGYSPNFNVWIKFTLKNSSNTKINKLIEYDNALSTNIELFYNNQSYKEGLFSMDNKRRTINPTFKIQLEANETKTYYLKANSYITTLIIRLKLWNDNEFYAKEIQHQVILSLFFGAMLILALYNFFIYFFTKDISYLYYVLYIIGISFHHFMYVGFSYIYMLSPNLIPIFIEFAPAIVAFPVFALALFTKSFLNIQQYYRLNKILNTLIAIIPISVIVFLTTDILDKYRNLLLFSIAIYLVSITVYAAIKRNRQAYFILFSWVIIFFTFTLVFLSSLGFFDIKNYLPYFVETTLTLEVIIFSIALADRIKHLQREKEEANEKLIEQQENEKHRLEIKVEQKTKDLQKALDEKGLLLKELNHRVKNNMQTIVSLIRLQGDDIEDEKIQDIFITIQNRINAMSHLHDLLYKQDNIAYVDAYEYFETLIDEIRDSYNNIVNIDLDIECELKMEQAIYCGLILNELITNSFKYAFDDENGKIEISLSKINGRYNLNVKDNGKGYKETNSTNSLGLILINTLAKEQLKGKISTITNNGVQVDINWSSNE